MTTVYRVAADSRHFSFEAFGATEAEARAAFREGLARHCATSGAAPEWAEEIAERADVTPLALPSFWRDCEPL